MTVRTIFIFLFPMLFTSCVPGPDFFDLPPPYAWLIVQNNSGSYSRIDIQLNDREPDLLTSGEKRTLYYSHFILNFVVHNKGINLIGYPKDYDLQKGQVLTVTLGPANLPDIGFLNIHNKTDSSVIPIIDGRLHEAYKVDPVSNAGLWLAVEEIDPDSVEIKQTFHNLNIQVEKYDQTAWDVEQSFSFRGRLDAVNYSVYMSDLELP